MQEHADELIQGIEIVEHILKPKLTIIGIEDNKPAAIKALEQAAMNKDIVIRVIPTKYPSGGEKQLIKILTNKEVPSGAILLILAFWFKTLVLSTQLNVQ